MAATAVDTEHRVTPREGGETWEPVGNEFAYEGEARRGSTSKAS
jgi:hypothetical protein